VINCTNLLDNLRGILKPKAFAESSVFKPLEVMLSAAIGGSDPCEGKTVMYEANNGIKIFSSAQ